MLYSRLLHFVVGEVRKLCRFFPICIYLKKYIRTCDRKGLSIQIIKVVNDLNVKAPEATKNSKESCIPGRHEKHIYQFRYPPN